MPPLITLPPKEHHKKNFPDVLVRWQQRDSAKNHNKLTSQSFSEPQQEIAATGYDLYLNRYKEVIDEPLEHRPPKQLIAKPKELKIKMNGRLEKLEGLLK